MKIQRINYLTFVLNKYKSYTFLFLFILSLCFPFNPPHNTFNLIENFHLPEIAYPISYVAIGITFILFVSSFGYKLTRTSEMNLNLNSRTLKVDGTELNLKGNFSYQLFLKSQDRYEDKNIWTLSLNSPISQTFNILLTHQEKQNLQESLNTWKTEE